MYVPLKITTDYSLLKSSIKMENLIPFFKEHNITAAAICDENLYGVMHFYDECVKNEIKPIIGLELEFNEIKMYCYPKNYNGYQNVLKLHSIKETRKISKLDLELYHHNIKIILPFLYNEEFEELNHLFEEVYLGYQSYYEKNNALLITDKIVYVRNIKALTKEDTHLLDYLKMIQLGKTKEELEKSNYEKNYFTISEVEEEDIQSTWRFIGNINIEIPKQEKYIPHFDKTIKDSYAYLVALSKKGLQKRLQGNIEEKYLNRLKYELNTIHKMGFVDYFLIVYDYVRYAKQNGILVGPGRGSAAGSLVSYCLGITEVDPLKYNLLFERFLNPERITMPDIDIDFEYTKRGKVIDYVKERYGKDKVAGIMTFGTLKSKLVLRDIGKCLLLDPLLINKFVNLIDAKKT